MANIYEAKLASGISFNTNLFRRRLDRMSPIVVSCLERDDEMCEWVGVSVVFWGVTLGNLKKSVNVGKIGWDLMAIMSGTGMMTGRIMIGVI